MLHLVSAAIFSDDTFVFVAIFVVWILLATRGRMMFESLKEKFMIVTADGKKDKLVHCMLPTPSF